MPENGKTTLLDVYRAGGAVISEDGLSAHLDKPLEPFEIVLRVVPTAVEMNYGEPVLVILGVILHDEYEVDRRRNTVNHLTYDEELKLPVTQIRIKKEDK